MKIGIVSFYSHNLSRGAENWVNELSAQLSKNHQLIIFKNQEQGINWNRPSSHGLLRSLFLDYWSIVILKFTFKILPIIWRNNFDIVIPINGGWQTLLIRILTWIKRSNMIVVGHSGKGWDDRINLWCFPDVFVALTDYAKTWAKKVNPAVKVEYIPNGVNLEKFNPAGKKLQIKLKNPIVLCVSALVKSKRIELTIKALALLNSVSLLVVGKGEEEKRLGDLGNRLLGERFHIINLPFSEMPKVYRLADVFTLVSWKNEAFPLVYLEAMASGLAVVVTDDPIRKEIIGDAGILVDPYDTKTYAYRLKKALEKNWQDKPRSQAEKFSWNVVAKRYEEIMTDVIYKND